MNLKTEILTFEGNAYKDDKDKDLTLGMVLSIVLITTKATDPLRSYLLTQKIAGKDEAELSAEEVVYLKEMLKKNAESEMPTYNPHILGQSIHLIDSKPEKPE